MHLFYRQKYEWDCGVAATLTVARHFHGVNFDYEKIIRHHNWYFDLNLGQIRKLGDTLGVDFTSFYIKPEAFSRLVFKNPLICQVFKEKKAHFVVIFEKNENKLLIADPEKSVVTWVDIKKFLKNFTGIILTSKKTIVTWDNKLWGRKFIFWTGILWPSFYLILTGLLFTFLAISLQYCFKLIIDYVIPINLIDIKIVWITVFVVVFFSQVLINFLIKEANIRVSIAYKERWNLKFFHRVNNLSYVERKVKTTAAIVKNLQYLNEILDYYFPMLAGLFQSVFLIIASSIILGFYSHLTFLILVFFFIISIVLFVIFTPLKKEIERVKICEDKKFSEVLIRDFTNFNDQKRRNLHQTKIDNWKKKYEKNLNIAVKSENFDRLFGTMRSIIIFLAKLIVIFSLIGFKEDKKIELGLFIFLFGMAMNVIEQNFSLIDFVLYKQRIQKLKKEVENFLWNSENPKNKGNFSWKEKQNQLVISNVNFSYDSLTPIWKKNINFEIKKNIIFLGSPGSGKTTMLKLIAKELNPSFGEIFLNKKNTKHINRSMWQEEVCFITSDSQLDTGTVFENVINFHRSENVKKKWEEYKINYWLQRVSLDDDYDVDGKTLSSGQKQVVVFLSMFFSFSKIFLVDEGLSAVSNKLRAELIKFFNEKCVNKFFLYATHDTKLKKIFKTHYIFSKND